MSKLDFLEISRNFKSYYRTLRDVHFYLTNDSELSPLELQAVSKVLSKLIYGFIRIKGTSFREMDREQFEQEFNLFHQDFLNVIQNSGENNVAFNQFTALIDEIIGIAVKRTIALGKIKKVKQESLIEDEEMAEVTDAEWEFSNEDDDNIADDEVIVDGIEVIDEIKEVVPEVEALSTEAETLSTDVETLSTDVETLGTEVKTFSSDLKTFDSNYIKFSTGVKTFSTDVETFSTDVETFSTDVETFSTDVETFSTDVETFSTDVKPSSSDVKTFSSDVKTFSSDVKTFNTDVETQSNEVEVVLDDIGNAEDEQPESDNEVVIVVNDVKVSAFTPKKVKNNYVDAAPVVNNIKDHESSDNFRFRPRRRKNR
ncbi:hypothetical protein V7152_11735 [Neobacillus drentensis]|uniref:hypothetical protein n=1 Tax=Neobacillus drentensis TaxID=220684 RepID=UPI0030004262